MSLNEGCTVNAELQSRWMSLIAATATCTTCLIPTLFLDNLVIRSFTPRSVRSSDLTSDRGRPIAAWPWCARCPRSRKTSEVFRAQTIIERRIFSGGDANDLLRRRPTAIPTAVDGVVVTFIDIHADHAS